MLVYLAAAAGFLAVLGAGLVYALSPAIYVNPGVSAYAAPPGTELLPRRIPSKLPDLAQVDASGAKPGDTVEAATDPPPPAPAHRQFAKSASKPRRTASRQHEDHRRTLLGFAPPQGNWQPWF